MPAAKYSIFFWSLFLPLLAVNVVAVNAWPRLRAPGTPAPMRLFLRPAIPLQELMELAQKNESYGQAQIQAEVDRQKQGWCALAKDKRLAQKEAWLSGLHSYQRALELSRRRFDQKVRSWLSKNISEYRQKGLLELQATILALQTRRHRAILDSLKNSLENLDCGKVGSAKGSFIPPKLHYKALYWARYEFWKRLSVKERLLLRKALGAS